LKAVWCKGGKDACNSGTDNGEIPRHHYSAKAVRRRAREARVVERHVHERRKGVIAAKVRTMEERAEERDSWTAAWCKGGKDACKGGKDNGEILRWPSGAKAARSRAREDRAVERQIRQPRNGGCNGGKGSNSGGTDRSERFIEISMV